MALIFKFMYVEIKNQQTKGGKIEPLYDYLSSLNDACTFMYMGLVVEIDPSVDFEDQNVLIRWTDTEEGFNDKSIYYSLEDFQADFEPLDKQ